MSSNSTFRRILEAHCASVASLPNKSERFHRRQAHCRVGHLGWRYATCCHLFAIRNCNIWDYAGFLRFELVVIFYPACTVRQLLNECLLIKVSQAISTKRILQTEASLRCWTWGSICKGMRKTLRIGKSGDNSSTPSMFWKCSATWRESMTVRFWFSRNCQLHQGSPYESARLQPIWMLRPLSGRG